MFHIRNAESLILYDISGKYYDIAWEISENCGSILPHYQEFLTYNKLFIHFHTDEYSNNNNGFKVEYFQYSE